MERVFWTTRSCAARSAFISLRNATTNAKWKKNTLDAANPKHLNSERDKTNCTSVAKRPAGSLILQVVQKISLSLFLFCCARWAVRLKYADRISICTAFHFRRMFHFFVGEINLFFPPLRIEWTANNPSRICLIYHSYFNCGSCMHRYWQAYPQGRVSAGFRVGPFGK